MKSVLHTVLILSEICVCMRVCGAMLADVTTINHIIYNAIIGNYLLLSSLSASIKLDESFTEESAYDDFVFVPVADISVSVSVLS